MTPSERRPFDPGDQLDDEIIALIRRAADEETKAVLIVVHKIRNEFKTGGAEIRELIAKAVVAYKTVAWVIGIVGFAMIGMGSIIISGYITAIQTSTTINDVQNREIMDLKNNTPISREARERILILEKNVTDILGKQIDLEHRFVEQERYYSRQRAKDK